jgi:hypothetical protein
MKFSFNQPVTLKSDPDFFGYAWGRTSVDDGEERIWIAVKKPGKTKFRAGSHHDFPESDVQPTEERKTRARPASETAMADQVSA